ncbi:MFS transporter [Helicobacter apodemus]|uniref:MFS transporter n=1 Tax=Helicobacter apodemus TaxID=135569 RepID=UPI000AD37570|nr:MFS transporter [Helicobacter apodemus]
MTKTNPLLLPTLMLGVFVLLSMELGMMGVLPIVAEVYNVSVADAGWVVSIFALIVVLVAPILPPLLTKYDAKKVLLTCLLVFSVSSFLAAFCTNFIVLLNLARNSSVFSPYLLRLCL